MHSIQRGTKAILACRHIPRSQFVQSVPTLRFSGRQMAGEFTTAKASLDKTTSDEEWTKVLSPEEVCNMHSAVFYTVQNQWICSMLRRFEGMFRWFGLDDA